MNFVFRNHGRKQLGNGRKYQWSGFSTFSIMFSKKYFSRLKSQGCLAKGEKRFICMYMYITYLKQNFSRNKSSRIFFPVSS